MLIVALQDDVGNLYAIWNTVTDRFLGVNLGKYEAVGIIMDYKGDYTFEKALERVEHPQQFIDIAKCIVNGCSSEKDIKKILQSKDEEIRELRHIIDEKLGEWTKDKRYGLTFKDLMLVLEKAEKYDKLSSQSSKAKSEILLDMCYKYNARITLFLNGHEIPNVRDIISAAEVGDKKQLVVVFEADELKIRDIDGKIKEY